MTICMKLLLSWHVTCVVSWTLISIRHFDIQPLPVQPFNTHTHLAMIADEALDMPITLHGHHGTSGDVLLAALAGRPGRTDWLVPACLTYGFAFLKQHSGATAEVTCTRGERFMWANCLARVATLFPWRELDSELTFLNRERRRFMRKSLENFVDKVKRIEGTGVLM